MGTTTEHINRGEVIRIDGRLGDDIVVTKWTVKWIRKLQKRRNTHKQYILDYNSIFPTPFSTRVELSRGPDKYYRHSDQRTVSSPQWPDESVTNLPMYIQWISDILPKHTITYAPEIFTDGSYSMQPSLTDIFMLDFGQ